MITLEQFFQTLEKQADRNDFVESIGGFCGGGNSGLVVHCVSKSNGEKYDVHIFDKDVEK